MIALSLLVDQPLVLGAIVIASYEIAVYRHLWLLSSIVAQSNINLGHLSVKER